MILAFWVEIGLQKLASTKEVYKIVLTSDSQGTSKPQISSTQQMDALLGNHKAVFDEGLGKISTFEATLQLKPNVNPKFCKARPVPYALQMTVEWELDQLEDEDTLERVANIVAPTVPVPKPGEAIHTCGNYKVVTVNLYFEVDQYP